MRNVCRPTYALATLVATFMISPAAQAAVPGETPMSYDEMCVQSADMPKPFGESDLKGNPKLKAYCGCFGPKFMARAQVAAQNMGKPPRPAALIQKEELEMRNSCRQQLGLPLAKPKS
jgi:hypothetical protein